ncbi:MAG: hypothetical protein GY937_07020 [bacterium]|nr:hypothetical protein [bacterium]
MRVLLVSDSDAVPYFGQPIKEPSHVWQLLKDEAATWDRERFLVLALDGRHKALGLEEVSVGSVSASVVHPREVFKGLVLANELAPVSWTPRIARKCGRSVSWENGSVDRSQMNTRPRSWS